jgi:hypothetical protein
MQLQVQQLASDLKHARNATKEAEDANTHALQEIQKSAAALESRRCELQDAQEQIKQLQVCSNVQHVTSVQYRGWS